MAPGRGASTVLVAVAVLGLGLGLAEPAPDARPRLTEPTSIALDFRDTTVADVAKVIGERSGKRVTAYGTPAKGALGVFHRGGPIGAPPGTSWRDRKVTLRSTEPVQFWQAIDRLAEAGGLRYRLAEGGDIGSATHIIAFEGEGDVPGLADYAGPFRVGLLGVHEHNDVLLVRGPWVQITPAGSPIAADAADLASAPKDGGPLYAELNVAAEPGLLCRRDGPLKALEAVDEAGGHSWPLRERIRDNHPRHSCMSDRDSPR